MLDNPGTDPFVPLSTPAGEGIYPTPKVLTEADDRDAANLDNAPDALADRTNWLGRRIIDFLHNGTASYTPRGTVKFLRNVASGWWFDCVAKFTYLVTFAGQVSFTGTSRADFQDTTGITAGNTSVHSLDGFWDFIGTLRAKTRIYFTGTQFAATADPGTNVATALSQAKAWEVITCNASGGASLSGQGYNVASADASGIPLIVHFANGMAAGTGALEYAAQVTTAGAGSGAPSIVDVYTYADRVEIFFWQLQAGVWVYTYASAWQGKARLTVHARQT